MKTKILSVAVGSILTLCISSQPAISATVSEDAIETFLGLATGTLDGLGPGQDATVGSAIKQDVVASTGGDFTFSWNFLTDEIDAASEVYDLAFFSIDGVATFLADASPADGTVMPPFFASSTIFIHETGFSGSATVTIDAGPHTLGFGILHTEDEVVQSGLLLDMVIFPGVSNGGFESGDFSDWDTIGVTSIETAAFGSGPVDGVYQAFLYAEDLEFGPEVPLPPAILFLGSGIAYLMARRRPR